MSLIFIQLKDYENVILSSSLKLSESQETDLEVGFSKTSPKNSYSSKLLLNTPDR